ncbi:MAG: hypothetical protein L0241_06145, partial [Planctomycetia bacterium]|nr:hypothetical protein [Planctomycetia bacterium]
ARVSERDWPAALEAIRASLADVPDVQHWFDEELAHSPYSPPDPPRLRPTRLGFDDEFLYLDASAFGVRDVAGASELCERLLNYKREGVRFRQESGDGGDIMTELQAKEALIQQLHAAGQELRELSQALSRQLEEKEVELQRQYRANGVQQEQIEQLTTALKSRRGFLGLL